jgi:GNAT superfamily N-acetyltransferase
VGCGPSSPSLAEIKRMYVDPAHRGRGLSRVVLQALVGFAREQGFDRVALETGEKQPEAIGLYESAGFVRVGPYGEWVGSGVCSLFFGLRLSGS